MESLYFLIPIALVFVGIAVKILFWAIKNGQYDNLDSEAHRILFDDEPAHSQGEKPFNVVANTSAQRKNVDDV